MPFAIPIKYLGPFWSVRSSVIIFPSSFHLLIYLFLRFGVNIPQSPLINIPLHPSWFMCSFVWNLYTTLPIPWVHNLSSSDSDLTISMSMLGSNNVGLLLMYALYKDSGLKLGWFVLIPTPIPETTESKNKHRGSGSGINLGSWGPTSDSS